MLGIVSLSEGLQGIVIASRWSLLAFVGLHQRGYH